uniref:PIN domain-containing protein n=1 Tax=Acidobacterium capsulatum TaxID=33075 RepID=A0A7V5CUQ8_9BACT
MKRHAATAAVRNRCFVDTNVLVYAHDRSTADKHRRARALVEELWESGMGVLSTQVLQELCVSLQRKSAHPPTTPELRSLIEDYSAWEVVTTSPAAIVQALEIQERYKTSFWDALILQAAESAGAGTLYSEDLAHNQIYGSVRVVNPFQEEAL